MGKKHLSIPNSNLQNHTLFACGFIGKIATNFSTEF